MGTEDKEFKFSVFPLYGDESAVVVTADSLIHAVEKVFEVQLQSVHNIEIDLDDEPNTGEICSMFGIVGALGKRPDGKSIVCSATVISYELTPARAYLDYAAIRKYMPQAFAA